MATSAYSSFVSSLSALLLVTLAIAIETGPETTSLALAIPIQRKQLRLMRWSGSEISDSDSHIGKTKECNMVTVHLELWLECSEKRLPIVKSVLVSSDQQDARIFNMKFACVISKSAQGADRFLAEANLRKKLEEDPLMKPLMPFLKYQNHWE